MSTVMQFFQNPALPCAFLGLALSLTLAPLLKGIINRVKSIFGGRKGRPLFQLYFDIYKLLHKSPVYSHTTTWFFKAAPSAGLTAGVLALCLPPFGTLGAVISFSGDFILLGGLFVLARFTLMLAALDTGSAFEGMGAAREAMFSSLAEPIFLFCLFILGFTIKEYSLAGMIGGIGQAAWVANWPFFMLIAASLFLLMLPENCRIPADDPTTHLELTMIHEVMILDHSGPDLAMLEYASALKLWTFCLLIAGVAAPAFYAPPPEGGIAATALSVVVTLALVFVAGALVGFVESVMARFKMERVPQILTLAGSFACLAALSLWR